MCLFSHRILKRSNCVPCVTFNIVDYVTLIDLVQDDEQTGEGSCLWKGLDKLFQERKHIACSTLFC